MHTPVIIIEAIACAAAAALAIAYLHESMSDWQDEQSCNQADPDATKGLRSCIALTRRVGLSYLAIGIVLAVTLVATMHAMTGIIVAACVAIATCVAIIAKTMPTLRWQRKQALLEEIDRHGEQLEQR